MTRLLVEYNGTQEVVESTDGLPEGYVILSSNVPEGFPLELRWNGEEFVPIAPSMPAHQIYYRLLTITERAKARKMVTAVWPEGHPLAGQLMDPDGMMQVLIDTMLASEEVISADSEFFQQGVALAVGLEVLTPERAAQVLAMQPPSE